MSSMKTSTRTTPLLILFTTFILIVSVNAQVCLNATRFAEVVPLCAPYLNNEDIQGGGIYLASDSPAFVIESILSNAGFKASRGLQFVAEPCRDYIYPFVCRAVFPPCDMGETLVVKKPLCYSSCQLVLDHCTGVVAADQLPDCDAISNTTLEPTYPKKSETVLVKGEEITVKCYQSENRTAPKFPFKCTYPMKNFDKDDIPDKDDWSFAWPCGLRCPTWIYSENINDYDSYWTLKYVIFRLGFAITLFICIPVFICMILGRKYWCKWPINLLLALFIHIVLAQTTYYGIFGPRGWGGCESDYQLLGPYSLNCIASGLLQTVLITLLLIWLSVIGNVLGSLVFHGNNLYPIVAKIIIAILLTVPYLAFIIWPLAAGNYGGDGSNCFINDHFEAPLYTWCATLSLGFVCFFTTVGYIYKTQGMKGLKKQYRLLFFVFLFGGVFSVSTGYGIALSAKKDELTTAVGDFLTCRISQWTASILASDYYLDTDIDCHLDTPTIVETNINKFIAFAYALNAFFFAVLFCKELYRNTGFFGSKSSSRSSAVSYGKGKTTPPGNSHSAVQP